LCTRARRRQSFLVAESQPKQAFIGAEAHRD
jgi:hypothetical protein